MSIENVHYKSAILPPKSATPASSLNFTPTAGVGMASVTVDPKPTRPVASMEETV